jgi:tetratricopeptide (TPR) repeat protein
MQPAKHEQPAAYAEVDPATVKKPAISASPTYMPAPIEQLPYASTPAARTPRTPEMQTRQDASRNFRPSSGSGEAAQTPIVHIDPLLDSELETTMKRPAIRLQPMQQPRMGAAKESTPPPSSTPSYPTRGRTSGSRGSEQGLTNQERLIAGYQHQLVGDYDEAMQEYRIIIRGAPDLLGEVISNIRALLKLAPKYSAGYRVLGDAYMRQGEYLQAMEAYNKALTMAKKKA